MLTRFMNSHYVTAGLYWIIVCTYFILSGSDSMSNPSDQTVIISFEKGAFYMFLAGALSLFVVAHYFFMKRFTDFESLFERCEDAMVYSNILSKKVDEPDAEAVQRENLALQDDLKHKEREIGELNQKVNEYLARIEALHEGDSNSSKGSHHIINTKKRALRAGRKGGVDTIESLKQEIGNLRNIFGKEKSEWEEEKKRLMEKSDNDYCYALINELCARIEDLQRQLMERESSEEERQALFEGLRDIKDKVEMFKKENVDEEKAVWETDRANLNQIINDLQEELDNNRLIISKQENIDYLKQDLERIAEENMRNESAKKSLTEKINEMGSEFARMEKELHASQEFKHNLDTVTAEVTHLQKAIVSKQEEIEKYQKSLKSVKDTVLEKENRIEEFEKINRTSDYQIKGLNEQVDELKKYLAEKETYLKQEREEQKKKLDSKDEELALMITQNQGLEKELLLARKSVQSEKEEEFDNLRVEAENLESKISSLTSLLKKQREQNNSLESQLQASELRNEDIAEKLVISQENMGNYRAAISELRMKLEAHEDLKKDYQKALSTIDQLNSMIESLRSEIQSLKDTIRSLDSCKKDKDFYEAQYHSSLQDLEQANKAKRDLELELVLMSNLKKENSTLSAQISKLGEALDTAKAQTADYRSRMSHQELEFDKERDELLLNFSRHKKEISQLERKLKNQEDYMENELEASQREQEKLADQVKNLTAQNEIYKQETARLNNLQAALKQQLSAKELEVSELSQDRDLHVSHSQEKKIYENQIEEIQKNLKNTEERLKEIVSEKESLREELATKHAELQGLSEDFAAFQSQAFENEKKRSFASPEMGERLLYSPMSEQSLENSARSVQDMIIIESMSPNITNPLLDNVAKLRKEPPMTYKNVWKLFEAMMVDKCKMDRLELAMGRQPRTMTEYMLDFVYIHYGLKTLALKQLKALVASLEQLYKQGHPYGILFCRFLGLFHPRPLPYQLSIYLLMVQEQFLALSSKVKDKPSTFSQNYEIIQYGGQASIIDVMELVQKLCRTNREVGERIITAMHKDRIDRIELSILKICGCMARMGRTSDFIFEILNAERTGHGLEYQDFIDGIRYTLNLWVTQEEAEDLCGYIDQENTGVITFDAWYSKVNFVDFADKMYSKAAMISKSDFLNSLVDEYEYEVVQDYYLLKQMIRYPVLNQATMASVLLQIDPNLEEEDLLNLYDEAKEQEDGSMGGVSPNALCVVVLKHNIGGYGVGMFDVYSLDNSLPKTSTEGVRTELIVERDNSGKLEIDLRKRNK